MIRKLTLSIGFAALILLTSGCKKVCTPGTDVLEGEIKTEISIFPIAGNVTQSLTPDQYLITASHPFASNFYISGDKGKSKSVINYNEYSILCFPMTVNCSAHFTREVYIDDVLQVIKYIIKVKECDKCDSKVFIENFLAIRAVPDSYQLITEVVVEEYSK